jgi:curved DNA-binding protein CbpA
VAAANLYELLEIRREATGQELRQAFRSLSKRYHPDTTELPEQEAREAFRRLQQAYLTLSDPAATAASCGGRGTPRCGALAGAAGPLGR